MYDIQVGDRVRILPNDRRGAATLCKYCFQQVGWGDLMDGDCGTVYEVIAAGEMLNPVRGCDAVRLRLDGSPWTWTTHWVQPEFINPDWEV